MQFAMALKIIGVLLILFSTAMLPPLFLSLITQDGIESAFAMGLAATLFAGVALWLPTRNLSRDLNIRDGFLVTALFWVVLGLFGAIPLWLVSDLGLTPIAAIFESISGLTTTGATVITGLDDLPQSLLFYRQLLQWLGGIGIIVLAVAVLPMLEIGGMQLYRAESAGPSKDRKLTPRITSTAKALFGIYLLLTIACAASYFAAGMSTFDAICHAFSTVAIGGFSTHDASLGHYEQNRVLLVSSVFMLLSAINFGLHFIALQRRNVRPGHVSYVDHAQHQLRDAGLGARDHISNQAGAGLGMGLDERRTKDHPGVEMHQLEALVIGKRIDEGAGRTLGFHLGDAVGIVAKRRGCVPVCFGEHVVGRPIPAVDGHHRAGMDHSTDRSCLSNALEDISGAIDAGSDDSLAGIGVVEHHRGRRMDHGRAPGDCRIEGTRHHQVRCCEFQPLGRPTRLRHRHEMGCFPWIIGIPHGPPYPIAGFQQLPDEVTGNEPVGTGDTHQLARLDHSARHGSSSSATRAPSADRPAVARRLSRVTVPPLPSGRTRSSGPRMAVR